MQYSDFYTERKSRIASMQSLAPIEGDLFFMRLEGIYPQYSTHLKHFAESIELLSISHGSLTAAQYMAHPYRVSRLLLENCDDLPLEALRLALAHNLIEVANSCERVKEHLGEELFSMVSILTVDRDKQWEVEYQTDYYSKIAKNRLTSIVKVFDKFDNLFLLSSNTDIDLKRKYLRDIENYLVPIAEQVLPDFSSTLKSVTKINWELLS